MENVYEDVRIYLEEKYEIEISLDSVSTIEKEYPKLKAENYNGK